MNYGGVDVRAHHDWERGQVRVRAVIDQADGPRHLIGRDGEIVELPRPGEQLPAKAFLVDLNETYARWVYDALRELFEGEKAPGDAYALRRDLEHEKGRVDKLIDHLLSTELTVRS